MKIGVDGMSESRRKFIRASLCAALFAALPLKNTFSQSFKQRDGNPGETPPVQTDPLGNYSKSAFGSYLNSVFQIQTVTGIVEVALTKIDDMPAPKGGECFSLLFRGGHVPLKQDTYVVVHPALGTFQLFLVPGGSDQNGARSYLAVMNRLSLADLANLSAPAKITSSSRNSSSPANSITTSASGVSATTQTPSTTTQATIGTATTVVPAKVVGARAKRMSDRKRVDPKTSVIN
jgi:hypothetical protein